MTPFLLPLALALGVSLPLRGWVPPDSYAAIFVHASVIGVTYLLSVLLLVLSAAERQFFFDRFVKLFAGLRGRFTG
jgi:hypothetical protein